jgi:hypothetical protein
MIAILLDHVIGAREQRRRDGEAERFRGLEDDDKLELRRLLNGPNEQSQRQRSHAPRDEHRAEDTRNPAPCGCQFFRKD